jgi:uncharacterized protein YdiU (UPF0061 family)
VYLAPVQSTDFSLKIDNTFTRGLPGEVGVDLRPRQVEGAFWSPVQPTPVRAPRVLLHAPEVADSLGLSAAQVESAAFAEVFGGNRPLPGSMPWATNYGGHQFGHWAGQLGDGRALSLAEVVAPDGKRLELQLKGAGPTPYSRRADGRAVLRSSVREFLCSEAMHHLGVPTTRALSLVATGEGVMRDMLYDGHPRMEPGAVVCRVAPSFVRFGHFELPASRGDRAMLERLLDFVIARDFPDLEPGPPEVQRAAFFREVCERTAKLVVDWMRFGFVHGVMNTDNMSILGLTIDYGPYGWLEPFDPLWTPNTTDAHGRRYRYGAQGQVAHWNLGRLASALFLVMERPEPLEAGLEHFERTWERTLQDKLHTKFGFTRNDPDDVALVGEAFRLLHGVEIDLTLFFRGLADLDLEAPSLAPLRPAFYDDALATANGAALESWLTQYAARARSEGQDAERRRAAMNAVNPRFVLRNWIAHEAIELAEAGDLSRLHLLLDLLRRPFDEQPEHARYAGRRPDWAKTKVGCSMLSCSS